MFNILLTHKICYVTEEVQKLGEMEEFALYSSNNRLTAVVANVVADPIASLCEVFDGCYGVFHTSSFIDPYCLSGYTVSPLKIIYHREKS